MRDEITHIDLRYQTGVKTSSVHVTFHFGYISKLPDILIDMGMHFILGSVYMIFYHPKWNFISVKMTDMKSIPARSFKRICALSAISNESALISFQVNSVHMKISCRFEMSFRSKWPIWNPYRFEFYFASIHTKLAMLKEVVF